jgi:tRNA threonylcarbamoyladenosine biosynthesis protein TsaE
MVTNISHSPAETESLGERWGRAAGPGLVIGLCGELGAGKTQFVKGLARGLGITARVHSPTFSLVNVYPGGRLKLFHWDLYRLDDLEQILAAGLDEYLRPDGVTVIEWADKVQTLISKPRIPNFTVDKRRATDVRWIYLEALSETERRISYEDTGG